MKLSVIFMIALSCVAYQVRAAPASSPLKTDDKQLDRDYAAHEPVVPVEAAIVTADEKPWEILDSETRRKVFFNDRLTMVLLEITPNKPGQDALAHYHYHDQITHILEGTGVVTIGKLSKVIGPGSTYILPSNVHHSMKVTSNKLVLIDMFTPTREDFRSKKK